MINVGFGLLGTIKLVKDLDVLFNVSGFINA